MVSEVYKKRKFSLKVMKFKKINLGFSDHFVHNNKYFMDYSSRAKISIYFNGMKRNFSAVSKVFYSYSEK